MSAVEIRSFEIPLAGTNTINNVTIAVKVMPHQEYSLIGDCQNGCTWGRASILLAIDICKDHVPEELFPYVLKHEQVELSALLFQEPRTFFTAQTPFPTDSCHNLANAAIYLQALEDGKLDFLHSGWLGERAVLEDPEAVQYRQRLYEYYSNLEV